MKKTGFHEYTYYCSVDYDSTDSDDILDIHKYLMKKKWYKIMFEFIKKDIYCQYNSKL